MRTPRAKVLGSSGDDSIHISLENTGGGPEDIVGKDDLAVMNGLEIMFFFKNARYSEIICFGMEVELTELTSNDLQTRSSSSGSI